MFTRSMICAVLAALLWVGPAGAEVVTFQAKTFSPGGYDLGTPHANDGDMRAYEAAEKEKKAQKTDSEEETDLVRPFSGTIKIIKTLVKIGDTVVPEQALVEYAMPLSMVESELHRLSRYDLQMLDTQVERLRISLRKKNEMYAEARMRSDRGLASQQELADSRKDIDMERMKLDLYQQLYRAEKDQNDMFRQIFDSRYGKSKQESAKRVAFTGKIQAPDAGVVLYINPAIMPGVELSKPTFVMRIGSIDPLLLRAMVHESVVVKLREGDKAKVTFDVLPGQTFEAVMSRVSMSASQTDIQFPSHYEVQLTMPNPGNKLKEGMRGNISVEIPDGPRS